MAENFFEINFQKLKELKRAAAQKAEQYRAVREELQSLNLRVENLERFLMAEVHASKDNNLENQLEEVLTNKTVFPERKAVPDDNRINFLAIVLYKENITGKGLTSKELFDLAKAQDPDYQGSLAYTSNAMYKLKKRGLVEKTGPLHFLTDNGRAYFGQLLDLREHKENNA